MIPSLADLEEARIALTAADRELEIARQRLSQNPRDPDLSVAITRILERRKSADAAVQVLTKHLLEGRPGKRDDLAF
jgi:hypothetical protein